MEILSPHGAGVVIEARHFCIMMRAVEKQDSLTITSAIHGSLKENAPTRAELLNLNFRN